MATPNFSQRLLRKGPLIEETYRACQSWDLDASVKENIGHIRSTNPVGAPNEGWLNEVCVTLSARFSPAPELLPPLVKLAQGGYLIQEWQQMLLWQTGYSDGLFSAFMRQWLYERWCENVVSMRTDDIIPWLSEFLTESPDLDTMSEYGTRRTARDFLRMAAAFGMVEGNPDRSFAHFTASQDAILFGLHRLAEVHTNARKITDAAHWRMFLLSTDQLERELVELHQFRRLSFESAGSLAQLDLPFASTLELAESLVA